MKKNGVFFIGISFFVLEMLTFLYYANEESDDFRGGSTRPRISLEVPVLKAVCFKLGTRTVHHKRTKRNRKMTLIMLLP